MKIMIVIAALFAGGSAFAEKSSDLICEFGQFGQQAPIAQVETSNNGIDGYVYNFAGDFSDLHATVQMRRSSIGPGVFVMAIYEQTKVPELGNEIASSISASPPQSTTQYPRAQLNVTRNGQRIVLSCRPK